MKEKATAPISIDLTQFKLHIELPHTPALTLQFTSPSRRFYLSVIALVVTEMKRLGRVTSIPLEDHLDLLALLNETIGGAVGSSEKEHLLPRIYRKWKDALPDLEEAPLFKVVGRKRDAGEGYARGYRFTEEQKDAWANLFEYRGSEEHVRLRLSIDTLGMGLDDVVITYGEEPKLTNNAAWEAFVADLKEEKKTETQETWTPPEQAKGAERKPWSARLRWPALALIIAAVAAFTLWRYAWYAPQEKIAPKEMVFPLPDKPSVAVLPFTNMSGDPEQDYICDGITEEIITALSKVEKLFVIARHSSFTYKGKAVKVQQVAQDLGVQYILEGSVRRSGKRIRITAQFVDAQKGHHLWAERYDRDLQDLFDLQDEITMKIIITLEIELTEGEQALVAGSGTDNLDTYLKILQARDLIRHQSLEDNLTARRLVEEAIALDPGYAQAYRWLGGTYYMDEWLGASPSPRASLRKAVEYAQKAIAMNDSLGCAHGLLGNIYIMRGEYEKGIAEAQQAVELEPNGADAHALLGMGLRFAGRTEEAIPVLERAIRLDPHASGWYMHVLAGAYRNLEKFEEATQWGEKAVHRNPTNIISRICLCSIYSQSGKMDQAQEQAREIMRLNPDFSLERFAKTVPQKDHVLKQRYIDALRKAGLK
jgi:TolB-like protein